MDVLKDHTIVKALSKKSFNSHSVPLRTRGSCEIGTGLGGQRGRQAYLGLDEHRA